MACNQLPSTITFAAESLAIIDRDGQAWLTAADLARALGYSRADKVGRLYGRHAGEFGDDMTALIETPTLGVPSNLITETRIFSPRGCHMIALLARTPRASAFRRWVLDVLESLQTPAIAPADLSMSPAVQLLLREHLEGLLHRFCGRSPAEKELQRLRVTADHMKDELRKARLALEHAEDFAKQLLAPPPAASLLPPELAEAMRKATQSSITAREAMQTIARTLDLPEPSCH